MKWLVQEGKTDENLQAKQQTNGGGGAPEGTAGVRDKANSEKNETAENKKHRTYLRNFLEDRIQFCGPQQGKGGKKNLKTPFSSHVFESSLKHQSHTLQ